MVYSTSENRFDWYPIRDSTQSTVFDEHFPPDFIRKQ